MVFATPKAMRAAAVARLRPHGVSLLRRPTQLRMFKSGSCFMHQASGARERGGSSRNRRRNSTASGRAYFFGL